MNDISKFEKIFQPCNIGKMVLKNRLVMPPMGNNFGTDDGYVTDQLIDYYNERAIGGAGLIITEMVSIDSPLGQRGSHQLRIDEDSYIEGLSRLTQKIRDSGCKIAIQLCHAGILAASTKTLIQPVAPSPVEYLGQKVTKELSIREIEDIINHFVKAALRAKAANFDGVEVHAAHGYLLAHFLSPAFNKRRDEFGGSVKNRARILLEVINRIRELMGQNYPVWCRMNGMEYGINGGLSIDEARKIARLVEKVGSDAIHVSAYGYGDYFGYNRAHMGQPAGNLTHLAAEIKKVVTIPVIAVGRIDLQLGEKLVRESKADLIAIGRGQIADPRLIKKAAEGRFSDIRPCISCNVCVDDLTSVDMSLHCSVNACVGKERDYKIIPAKKIKRVLVIGGGPGGMEAAITATLRGHEVTIFEKQPQLGGKLIIAAAPPHKEEILPFMNYLISQVEKLGIKVELEKDADIASITKVNPDVIVLATGGVQSVPKIPGIDCHNVVFAEDVLSGKTVGQKVIIIGGGLVGCETAEYLVHKGKTITIIEILSELAGGVGLSFKMELLNTLKANGTTLYTSVKCKQITKTGVVIVTGEGKEQTIEADTIVLAVGARPNDRLLKPIRELAPEIHQVGDCVKPRRILESISDGHNTGLAI